MFAVRRLDIYWVARKHLRPQYGSTMRCFFLMILFNNSFYGCPDSRQLLEGLCLIHEHGVVHGDLRTPNIVQVAEWI
jgi:serine/threonine protein kinase